MGAIWHRQMNINGISIHYAEGGIRGETVILLHGGGSDHSQLSWKFTLPVLAPHFRVFAPDLPGYGKSSKIIKAPLITFYADILRQFLAALKINRVHLIGLSMGGAVALQLTLNHPQSVKKLALVSSYGLTRYHFRWAGTRILAANPALFHRIRKFITRHPALIKTGLNYLVGDSSKIDKSLISDVLQAYHMMGNGEAWRQFILEEVNWRIYRTCFLDQIQRINQPVLIIHGAKDRLIPLKTIRKAALKFPDSRLIVFEKCGHWIPRESPQQFNRTLLEFLTHTPH